MMGKELFDVIRAIKGSGLTQPEVDAINAALSGENVMRPSKAITDYVKGIEKLAKLRPDGKVEAYMPTPNDRPTIGYGTTGPDVKMGTVWTVQQAEARFTSDFSAFAEQVRAAIGAAPTTQGQFDAMVSLAYNIGETGFRESTLLRLHKEGKYGEAKAQFARWNKQAGVVLNGLTKRRAYEAGVYA
ncbi:lysozyme [Sphingobium sp. H39-3-25]|uniref:lysozyme n=1 Tax=Sphingobium arseniciresistens TaxID=3030834 RepID=UPI0023B9A64F|nr:lysozyme [Sphingobium arseniciresistens]